MNKLVAIVCALIVVGGCATTTSWIRKDNNMEPLTIRWQRLVDESGQTCQRCGSTEQELKKAFHSLKQSFSPLGIKVSLEEKALDPATCAKDISQSNRIWVGERPLEEWLGAKVGKSPCATCCAELGDNVECRTVEVEGKTYEVIPADLIVKAGLLAASQLLAGGSCETCDEPCSGSVTSPELPSSGCCPKPKSSSTDRK